MQSIRAQDATQAERTSRAAAERISGAVRRVFEDAFAIVENTHDDLLAMQAAGVQDPAVYDALLRRMLEGGDRFGTWLEWDAGQAPGGQLFNARIDSQGRVSTYFHENGMEIVREPIPAEIFAGELYHVPCLEGRAFLLPPHEIDAAHGDPTLVTSFSRPLLRDGRVVGVLAVDVKLDTIGQAIAALDMPNGTALAVVAENGMVAAASDGSWIDKPLPGSSPAFARLLARARSSGDGTEILRGDSSAMLASWKAIRFAEVKNPWFVLMMTPQVSLLGGSWGDRLQVLAIASAAILVVLVLVMATMHYLVSVPLRRIGKIINDLGQGLFGMTIPCQARKDEIGDVARAIARLQDSSLEIARLHEENGEREYRSVVAREAELASISARFSASIKTVAGSLRNVSATVGGRSQALTATVEATTARLGHLSLAATSTRTSMKEAADATGALIVSIDAIGAQTRLCGESAASVERNAATTNDCLIGLGKSVGDIGTLVELISSIAAQINLIALNATIEAARAGEAGRSFAVVAQEVKTLAKRTSTAASAVSTHIQALESSSAGTHVSVARMVEAFNDMKSISSAIAVELASQMAATGKIDSLVEQAVRSAEISARTVHDLEGAAQSVKHGTSELHAQSHTLNHEVVTLNDQVASFVDFLKIA